MNYPLISEYIEAIKAAEENFEQLKHLRPVLDENGEPMFSSGNFAVVFKMKDERTGKLHAVKCFLKEQEGRTEAYCQIAEELEYVSSTFLTPIKYLDKELFVDTAQTTETEFPVLLMDWVEGQTLDKYIREHIDDQYELSLLAYQFSRLAMWLLPQPFAHGDLKPDNILVKDDGTLVLVDYDGMYVPAMKGQKARELGSPDFRHPSRTEDVFDEHIDDFSLVSILLSIKAIALQPELLEQYGASDRLLFSANDYRNLSESQVMDALKAMMQDTELASLYSLFILASSQNNLSLVSFRLFNLSRPDRTQSEEKNLTTEVSEEDLADSWVDNYGARYSEDWKRLLRGPSSKVVKTMVVNNQNYEKADMWVSGPIINKDTGKTTYWCSFDSFENGVLIYLGSEVWKDLTEVNPDSLWEVFSKGNYIIREARDGKTNEWMMDENSHPIMMITPMREMVHASWDSDNLDAYFKELVKTTDYSIKQGTECICDKAFERCLELKTVSIPDGLTTIGRNAFSGCFDLVSINIPESVLEIGDYAFDMCHSLKSIFIPFSVKNIGCGAFSDNRGLSAIIVDEKNPYYDSRDNCNAIIHTESNSIVRGCTSTIIPENIDIVGDYAFSGCEDMESIVIPYGIKEIRSYAFANCELLSSIEIPDSVSIIKDYAFDSCI